MTTENPIAEIELPNKALFRPDEVAKILGVSTMTVYRRIEDGTLAAVRIGGLYRIPRESLTTLLDQAQN